MSDVYKLGLSEMRLYSWGENNSLSTLGAENLKKIIKMESTNTPSPKERVNFSDDLLYVYTSGTFYNFLGVLKHDRLFIIVPFTPL